MNDLISRQAAIDVIDAVFPVDPMKSEYAQGIACGAALAKTYVEQLSSAQPEQRWIPVSERLPEPRVDVWVNSDTGQIRGYYEEHVGVWYASFGQGRDYLELIVNAWMPLPEPYKEGADE